ncbi:hypothetical protein EVAR_2433_1 [Eumeta japonica]|uniref:Reverse transcriptase/retrotransposon-derived protein RNase H-like domain-containing protein n=1 Tax=Eumeta variegata TaxID=151549 RepID=A0A4C1SP03_EUMVA|nr:hypothetical protein EVAR_2433_1 [Eumeta japonica]
MECSLRPANAFFEQIMLPSWAITYRPKEQSHSRRFISDASRIQTPLNALLTGSIKNSHPINTIGEALKAFDTCKDNLCYASLLAHPVCDAKLSLITDASNTSLASPKVLQRYKDTKTEL